MDYNKYKEEYQKVLLKETIRKGIAIKQGLIDSIKNTDKQNLLNLFLKTNNFEEKIMLEEAMLVDLGDDEEFRELVEKDIETIKELKKSAEDKLIELKEQNKEEDKDYKEDEEQDEDLVNVDMEGYEDLKFEDVPQSKNLVYGTQEYYIASIKFNVMKTINDLQSMKLNVDKCPSSEMLDYLSGEKKNFENIESLGANIQTMPGCDEELKMLTDEQIRVAQELNSTVDKYIEQYQQKEQKNPENKSKKATSLEEEEER